MIRFKSFLCILDNSPFVYVYLNTDIYTHTLSSVKVSINQTYWLLLYWHKRTPLRHRVWVRKPGLLVQEEPLRAGLERWGRRPRRWLQHTQTPACCLLRTASRRAFWPCRHGTAAPDGPRWKGKMTFRHPLLIKTLLAPVCPQVTLYIWGEISNGPTVQPQ